MKSIHEVAAGLGLAEDELIPYGRHKAKVSLSALEARRGAPSGKLVVVSSITPTPPGDGKTTVTIGLGQGLTRTGRRAVIARPDSTSMELCDLLNRASQRGIESDGRN